MPYHHPWHHGLKKSEQMIQSGNRREIARMHRDLLRRMEQEVRRGNRKNQMSLGQKIKAGLRKKSNLMVRKIKEKSKTIGEKIKIL